MNSLTGAEIGLARRESNREPTPDRFRSDQAMESQVVTPHTYCFEEFSLDVRTGELSSGEKKIPLREQSLQLLLALLERPGELVTREELMGRLWPPGTFVDSDRGLNKAVKHLREALGDSADEPHFIETFPRRGYRLLVPVTRDDQLKEEVEAVPDGPPPRSKVPIRVAVLVAAVVGLGIVISLS